MLGFLSRFVDSNDRELKRIQPFVDEANELEAEIQALSDAEIKARFQAIRDEIREQIVAEEPSDDEIWRTVGLAEEEACPCLPARSSTPCPRPAL